MAKKLPPVDVVVVGVGWTGGILARELTGAGMNVVGLERGEAALHARDLRLSLFARRASLRAPP